jgi:hypothetical protein
MFAKLYRAAVLAAPLIAMACMPYEPTKPGIPDLSGPGTEDPLVGPVDLPAGEVVDPAQVDCSAARRLETRGPIGSGWSVDEQRTERYDRWGNLADETRRDGSDAIIHEQTWSYRGEYIDELWVREGGAEMVRTYTWDGTIARGWTEEQGSAVSTASYIYDGSDMVRTEVDRGTDGTIDEVTHYDHNADGLITWTADDANNDGEYEYEEARTWQGGHVRTVDEMYYTEDSRYLRTFTRNAAGEAQHQSVEIFSGGLSQGVYQVQYTWSGGNNTAITVTDALGVVVESHTITWDRQNRLLSWLRDWTSGAERETASWTCP